MNSPPRLRGRGSFRCNGPPGCCLSSPPRPSPAPPRVHHPSSQSPIAAQGWPMQLASKLTGRTPYRATIADWLLSSPIWVSAKLVATGSSGDQAVSHPVGHPEKGSASGQCTAWQSFPCTAFTHVAENKPSTPCLADSTPPSPLPYGPRPFIHHLPRSGPTHPTCHPQLPAKSVLLRSNIFGMYSGMLISKRPARVRKQ